MTLASKGNTKEHKQYKYKNKNAYVPIITSDHTQYIQLEIIWIHFLVFFYLYL